MHTFHYPTWCYSLHYSCSPVPVSPLKQPTTKCSNSSTQNLQPPAKIDLFVLKKRLDFGNLYCTWEQSEHLARSLLQSRDTATLAWEREADHNFLSFSKTTDVFEYIFLTYVDKIRSVLASHPKTEVSPKSSFFFNNLHGRKGMFIWERKCFQHEQQRNKSLNVVRNRSNCPFIIHHVMFLLILKHLPAFADIS